jgi:hypothetical protein
MRPLLSGLCSTPPVLIRPDGYVAWVGDLTQLGLADSLTSWFGAPNSKFVLSGVRLVLIYPSLGWHIACGRM